MTPTCAAILENLARHFRDRTPIFWAIFGLARAEGDTQAGMPGCACADGALTLEQLERLGKAVEGEFREETL